MSNINVYDYPVFNPGDKVCVNSNCVKEGENPWKYVVIEFCDGFYVLADTIEDFNRSTGRMYRTEEIITR